MPAFSLELKPPGRPAAPHKAKNRYISPTRRALEEPEVTKEKEKSRIVSLTDAFAKVAREDDTGTGDSAGSAASDAPHPVAESKIARRKLKDTERLREFNEAAAQREDEDGSGPSSPSPQPDFAPKPEPKKLRDTERLRQFNEAAREDDEGRSEEGAAEAPAPAGEAKIRRRKRKRDRDKEHRHASVREDRDGDDGGNGGKSRRRRKDRDPPRDDDPPRPRRTRKRDFDRGM